MQLFQHVLALQSGFECLQEFHHLRLGFEIGEVVVHPEQYDTSDAIANLRCRRCRLQRGRRFIFEPLQQLTRHTL